MCPMLRYPILPVVLSPFRVVSQFEFLIPLHQGACGQTETLPTSATSDGPRIFLRMTAQNYLKTQPISPHNPPKLAQSVIPSCKSPFRLESFGMVCPPIDSTDVTR